MPKRFEVVFSPRVEMLVVVDAETAETAEAQAAARWQAWRDAVGECVDNIDHLGIIEEISDPDEFICTQTQGGPAHA